MNGVDDMGNQLPNCCALDYTMYSTLTLLTSSPGTGEGGQQLKPGAIPSPCKERESRGEVVFRPKNKAPGRIRMPFQKGNNKGGCYG